MRVFFLAFEPTSNFAAPAAAAAVELIASDASVIKFASDRKSFVFGAKSEAPL